MNTTDTKHTRDNVIAAKIQKHKATHYKSKIVPMQAIAYEHEGRFYFEGWAGARAWHDAISGRDYAEDRDYDMRKWWSEKEKEMVADREKRKQNTPKTVTDIYNMAKANVYIKPKGLALLVRNALKTHFPDVKFSVTSDADSINVRWVGGPERIDVEQVVSKYKTYSFDGMTDSSIHYFLWLAPDGSVSRAYGSDSKNKQAPHSTDAVLLSNAAAVYVFVEREKEEI